MDCFLSYSFFLFIVFFLLPLLLLLLLRAAVVTGFCCSAIAIAVAVSSVYSCNICYFLPLCPSFYLSLFHRKVPSHAMQCQCQCQCAFSTLFIRFALTDLLNKSTEMHAHLSIILNNTNVLTKSLNGDVIVRSCAMASQSMWIAKSITFNILCVFSIYFVSDVDMKLREI